MNHGDTVRLCWEAEERLVVGFERVALCHRRLLDDMMDGHGDKDVLERLKQDISMVVGECSVGQLSGVLMDGVERMMVLAQGEREGGRMDRVMDAMADGLKDMMSSLDVLKERMEDCGVAVVEGDGEGWGAGVLRDVSMADCLVENKSLMEFMVERIVAEARTSALVSLTREDMAAMVRVARCIHVDWID